MRYLIAAAVGTGLGVLLGQIAGEYTLLIAFVAGSLTLMALSEDEELEDKRQINRMADASRRGRTAGNRQWRKYYRR